jgi:hypothetical protein
VSIAMAAPVDRRRRSAVHCRRAVLKRLNFVHHNVSRAANKPRYRRVEWSGNPQVSATSFRFGKRTALAPRRLVRCRHRAASVVPWSARSMRFARARFNRSPPAWLQPDRLY